MLKNPYDQDRGLQGIRSLRKNQGRIGRSFRCFTRTKPIPTLTSSTTVTAEQEWVKPQPPPKPLTIQRQGDPPQITKIIKQPKRSWLRRIFGVFSRK